MTVGDSLIRTWVIRSGTDHRTKFYPSGRTEYRDEGGRKSSRSSTVVGTSVVPNCKEKFVENWVLRKIGSSGTEKNRKKVLCRTGHRARSRYRLYALEGSTGRSDESLLRHWRVAAENSRGKVNVKPCLRVKHQPLLLYSCLHPPSLVCGGPDFVVSDSPVVSSYRSSGPSASDDSPLDPVRDRPNQSTHHLLWLTTGLSLRECKTRTLIVTHSLQYFSQTITGLSKCLVNRRC